MRGARAWAAGDSGLWVPAPTHSRVPPPATPHPPGKGKSKDRNCICMWSSGPPSPGHLDRSRRLENTGGINEHGGLQQAVLHLALYPEGGPHPPDEAKTHTPNATLNSC